MLKRISHRNATFYVTLIVSSLVLCLVTVDALAQSPEGAWGTHEVLWSRPGYACDHPIVLGDAEGRVHVFWIGWDQPGSIETDVARSMWYSRLDQGAWTKPNSIAVSPNDLTFDDPSADIDEVGILHLVWSDGTRLYYSQAQSEQAESARSWSTRKQIAAAANESSLKIDWRGAIHVVYTRHDLPSVWHVSSNDSGATWSNPVLAGTIDRQEGVRGVRLAISGDGTLHVVWSLDKYPEAWPSMRLLYTKSSDGGRTWDKPWEVTSRDAEMYAGEGAPWYLNVATDGADRVFLTWDGAPDHQRYFQQSNDRGATWMPRMRIFEDTDRGRNLYNPIAVDSAGHVHVVTANYSNIRYTWFDGDVWSAPVNVGPVSQPQLAITEGNLLHLVRRQIMDNGEVEIWYNSHRVDAPQIAPTYYPPAKTASPTATDVVVDRMRQATVLPQATATPPRPQWRRERYPPLDDRPGAPLILATVSSAAVVLLVLVRKSLCRHR